MASQYKQIGNAVPVNMAYELGLSIVDFLNRLCHTGQVVPAGVFKQMELPMDLAGPLG